MAILRKPQGEVFPRWSKLHVEGLGAVCAVRGVYRRSAGRAAARVRVRNRAGAQVAAPTMPVVLYAGLLDARARYGDRLGQHAPWRAKPRHPPADPARGHGREPPPENTIKAIVDKGRGRGRSSSKAGAVLRKQGHGRCAGAGKPEFLPGRRRLLGVRRQRPAGNDPARRRAGRPPESGPRGGPGHAAAGFALLYRLCADLNPTCGPEGAAGHGNFQPFSMAWRASASRATPYCARAAATTRPARADEPAFNSPVFPGETLRFGESGKEADRHQFRVTALERGVVVLTNGTAHHQHQ